LAPLPEFIESPGKIYREEHEGGGFLLGGRIITLKKRACGVPAKKGHAQLSISLIISIINFYKMHGR
jgi:hypothetical protein